MTINEVIAELAEQNREAAGEKAIAEWCSSLDAEIFTRVMGGEDFTPYVFPDDGDKALLVGAPYDGLYFWYCCAMIDLQKREYSDYANLHSMFNSLYTAFAKAYIRGHRPETAGQFCIWEG